MPCWTRFYELCELQTKLTEMQLQLDGDWDWLWFFYDYDQTVASTKTALFDWTKWFGTMSVFAD